MFLLAMSCLFFHRRQKIQNNNSPITAAPPTPTPMPTPSVAGFDSPDESEDEDEDVLVDDGVGDTDDVDVRGLDVSFARPRISPFSLSHKPFLSAQQPSSSWQQ